MKPETREVLEKTASLIAETPVSEWVEEIVYLLEELERKDYFEMGNVLYDLYRKLNIRLVCPIDEWE